MQHIHRHALDERRHFHDERVCAACVDDGTDDVVIIPVLVAVGRGVEQLLHNVSEFARQRLAHLGAGILGGGKPAHGNEPPEHYAVPVVKIRHGGFGLNKLFARVIDERRERAPLRNHKRAFKRLVDLVCNCAGAVVQNVQERFMLAMDVAHEVFCALRQVQDSSQVDDLRTGRLRRRVLPRKEREVAGVSSVHGNLRIDYYINKEERYILLISLIY